MKIEYPSEDQIPALKRLWAKCFPDPESFIDGFFATGFSKERCHVLDNGKAALYWFNAEYKGQKLAYLYAVATDPDFRGQGLCRRLMEDTHALLKAQGYAAGVLLPGEPGLRKMYEKMGYRDCCTLSVFSCEAGEKIPITKISGEAYAALRPSFLPENGAVQDGVAFLSSYASFYRGEDFLLAAAGEGESLLGLELLGNRENAPGILASLGCKIGTFRTPGTDRKTVMAHVLQQDVELPVYVGLTFD